MGYMVLTDFHTFAPVILRSDRIIEVAETKLRGTCLRTEYTACPSVYVRGACTRGVLEVASKQRRRNK